MNMSMQTYLDLVEGARPSKDPSAYDCQRAVVDLLSYAIATGSLRSEGVWRLHRTVAQSLEDWSGYRPPGGWKKFCALAAGCGVVQARSNDFIAATTLDEVEGWDVDETRRRLLEGFTIRLVPPQAAAGFFLLLGVHPLWGLRLAHEIHGKGRVRAKGEDIESHMIERIDQMVFGALSGIVAALRQLEPGRRYGLDALGSLVGQCCARARRLAMAEALGQGQMIFIDDDEPWLWTPEDPRSQNRALDFTTEGLIGSVLVPAAALTRFDDGTFCVAPSCFGGVQVGNMNESEQNRWLAGLISGDLGDRVA